MEWDGRAAAVRMPELAMRSALPHLREPEVGQDIDDLAGLEDRYVAHG